MVDSLLLYRKDKKEEKKQLNPGLCNLLVFLSAGLLLLVMHVTTAAAMRAKCPVGSTKNILSSLSYSNNHSNLKTRQESFTSGMLNVIFG